MKIRNIHKHYILPIAFLILSFFIGNEKSLAQIDDDFYKGFWHVGLTSKPLEPAVGIQFFEFNFYHNRKGILGGVTGDIRTRALPDLLGIGKQATGKDVFSFAEWRIGYNANSKDKFNWAIMWNPLNIWVVKDSNINSSEGFATSGFSLKFDRILTSRLMLRYIFSMDFGLNPSNKVIDGAVVLVNTLELNTKKRFFGAVDYLYSSVGFDNEEMESLVGNRLELRVGYRLF